MSKSSLSTDPIRIRRQASGFFQKNSKEFGSEYAALDPYLLARSADKYWSRAVERS